MTDFLDDKPIETDNGIALMVVYWAVPALLLLVFPWAAVAMGVAEWSGVYSFSCISMGMRFLLVFFILTVFLVWPVHQFVCISEWPARSIAFVYCVALLCLPLLAVGYYIGNIHGLNCFHELLVMTVPSVVLSLLLLTRTDRVGCTGFVLAATLFFPAFVYNEILGPFQTSFSLLSKGTGYLELRTILSGLAVGWVAAVGCLTTKDRKKIYCAMISVFLLWAMILWLAVPGTLSALFQKYSSEFQDFVRLQWLFYLTSFCGLISLLACRALIDQVKFPRKFRVIDFR